MVDHKPLFVPDASVLLKWIIYEKKFLEQALLFRGDFKRQELNISIPSHCYVEVCNALGREYKDEALSFITFLIGSELNEFALSLDLAQVAFRLMGKFSGITFYDACYHALAIRDSGTFITADEKYYKKTHKEGSIMLLKDYGKKR